MTSSKGYDNEWVSFTEYHCVLMSPHRPQDGCMHGCTLSQSPHTHVTAQCHMTYLLILPPSFFQSADHWPAQMRSDQHLFSQLEQAMLNLVNFLKIGYILLILSSTNSKQLVNSVTFYPELNIQHLIPPIGLKTTRLGTKVPTAAFRCFGSQLPTTHHCTGQKGSHC